MTDLETKAKRLTDEDMVSLHYRIDEGIASDDEVVLFRIRRMNLPEIDARNGLKEYRESFIPDCAPIE